MKKHSQKGFTLIELLVVLAIIGILASLVLSNLATARAKARDTQRKSDLRALSTALEMWADNNGYVYPSTASASNLTDFELAAPESGVHTSILGKSLQGTTATLDTKYIKSFPSDPIHPTQKYYHTGDAKDYVLWAKLEAGNANEWFCVSSGSSATVKITVTPSAGTGGTLASGGAFWYDKCRK